MRIDIGPTADFPFKLVLGNQLPEREFGGAVRVLEMIAPSPSANDTRRG